MTGVVWKENDGNQNFTEHTISAITNIDLVRNVYAIDIDNDGDIDILSEHETNSYTERTIVWSKNDGNQNFTDQNISLPSTNIGSIQLIDIDKDGDIDFLSYRTDTNTTVWYENDGNQNFTEHTVFVRDTRHYTYHKLIASDVDGDGHIDIVSALDFNYGEDEAVKWYRNDGNQNFSEAILIPTTSAIKSIKIVDIDGDEDMDILIGTNDISGQVFWYENDANQNYTRHLIYHNVEGYWFDYIEVDAQDIDGDGDLDIVSAMNDYGTDKMAWHKNDGNQVFTTHPLTTSTSGTGKNIFGDSDGDGDLDYFYTNYKTIIIQEQILGYKTPENIAEIPTPLVATDVDGDTLTYDISGDDASYFSINDDTGTLTFGSVPDYEAGVEDNSYNIIISVSDGKTNTVQSITILVEDVAEEEEED